MWNRFLHSPFTLLSCLAVCGLLVLAGCKGEDQATDGKQKSPAPGPPATATGGAPSSGQAGFAIGDIAPEIVGEDVDGQQFRLSEYRGKVVVLDFWGDW